jgi:hypothetical protein
MIIAAWDNTTATDQGWGNLHSSGLVIRTTACSVLEANEFPRPFASVIALAEPIKVPLTEPAISSAALPS